MLKKVGVSLTVFVISVTFVNLTYGGLVDYKRRKTGTGGAAAPTAPRATTPPAPDSTPFWAKQSPRAEAAIEKKYDTNRDGLLQTAEVKIFLRDIIDIVTQKGGYTVDSAILKAYDKNKDGVINSYELTEIKNHAFN